MILGRVICLSDLDNILAYYLDNKTTLLYKCHVCKQKCYIYNTFWYHLLVGCLHRGPRSTSVYFTSLYIKHTVPGDCIRPADVLTKCVYVHLYVGSE